VRYRLSYAEVREWLAERGIHVDQSTIYRWVKRFLPLFGSVARRYREPVSPDWRVDETYIRIRGRWHFPWLVRQAGQGRADLLIAPSLDWSTAKNSHARIASVRAVENGVSLLRPSGDGLSQAIDHQGRVLAAVDSFATEKPVFLTSLPAHGVGTVYSVVGDSFAYLSMLGLVLLAGRVLVRRSALAAPRRIALPGLA
jgi:hypothetical protein